MVSIKDVAAEAGVAISTVSKVLNNYPNVTEKTKIKVNRAVEKLNFVPNSVAAALSSKQAGRVAILMNWSMESTAMNEISMQYLSGAITKAKDLHLDVIMLFSSMFEGQSVGEITRYLQSQSITGMILFGLSKEDTVLLELVESQKFKCVVVDAPMVNESTSSLSVDHEKAQYEVARKTIEGSDVKEVLYIAGTKSYFFTNSRLKGIKRLCEDKNLNLTIKYGELSERKARNITLKYGNTTDAVICASDLMAIGAMKALIDMDVFHPVSGFDGLMLMGYVGKQMNTVKLDFFNIAGLAVQEIQLLLNGEAGREIVTDYELVRLTYEDIIR